MDFRAAQQIAAQRARFAEQARQDAAAAREAAKKTRRVRFVKEESAGYGDTRYGVYLDGERVGQVEGNTNTEVRTSGGRRYGNPTSVRTWEFRADGLRDHSRRHSGRVDAAVALLVARGMTLDAARAAAGKVGL